MYSYVFDGASFLQVFQTKREDPDSNIGIVIDYTYVFCESLETVQAKA